MVTFILTAVLGCVAPVLHDGAHEGPPLAGREVLLLLELAVPESDILEAARSFGGFDPVDDDERKALADAGATATLLAAFPAREPEMVRVAALAKACDAWRSDELGVQFLHPLGWHVHGGHASGGGTVVHVTPESGDAAIWFAHPQLFVLLAERTGLAPDTADAVLDQLTAVMLQRMRGAHVTAAPAGELDATAAGRPVKLRLIDGISADHKRSGTLAVGLTVDARGRAVGVGFLAPAGQFEAVVAAFKTFADSLAIKSGG